MMLDTIQDRQHELMVGVHSLFIFFYSTSIHLTIFEKKCLILLGP